MNQLSLLIIIGTVAMLLLALSVVFFVIQYQKRVIGHQLEIEQLNEQRRQELIQASIQGEEEERMRIASELHDDVGATLASVRLFLHHVTPKDTTDGVMSESKQLLDESIRKIRDISHKLQPAVLQQLGLRAALQAHADLLSRSQALTITSHLPEHQPRLRPQAELSLYRIVQELSNNIIKHARAGELVLETAADDHMYGLTLRHNGQGIGQAQYNQMIFKPGAIGLKNIKSRLEAIPAQILFSGPEAGWWSICISVNI